MKGEVFTGASVWNNERADRHGFGLLNGGHCDPLLTPLWWEAVVHHERVQPSLITSHFSALGVCHHHAIVLSHMPRTSSGTVHVVPLGSRSHLLGCPGCEMVLTLSAS